MDSINIGRIAYLTPAVLFDLVFVHFFVNPGTTKAEMLGGFLMMSWMVIGSLVLSIPLFPYVVWRYAKQERPFFWTLALIVASFPLILTFVGGL